MRLALVALTTLSLLTLTACGGRKHYNAGLDAELSGRDWLAAQQYVEALSKRPRHDKTRKAVLRTAEDGMKRRMAQLERMEREGRHMEARDGYIDLARMADLLEDHALLDFDVPNFDSRAEAALDAGLDDRFARGNVAMLRGDWEAALDHFEQVRTFDANYAGLGTSMDEAWATGAEQAEQRGDWRLAVRRLDKAHDSGRAALLLTALGEHHMATGSCRQATEDLEAALGRDATATRETLLAQALECAAIDISLAAVKVRNPDGPFDTIETERALRDAVLDELDGKLSRHVRFVPPRSRTAADYTIETVVHEAWLDRVEDVDLEYGTASVPATCDGRPCSRDVDIRWTEMELRMEARLEGTLRVRSSESEVWTHRFEGRAAESTTWVTRVDAPRDTVLPNRVLELMDAATDLPHPRDLAYQTIDHAAEDIAHFVIDTVDSEEPARDPTHLDLGST